MPSQRLNNRLDPAQLLPLVHFFSSRPRRFPADIENHRSVPNKLLAVPNSRSRIQVLPPIRERVRSDVDDAHQLRVHRRSIPSYREGCGATPELADTQNGALISAPFVRAGVAPHPPDLEIFVPNPS